MISITSFRELALSFPATTEQPHFELSSFRVNNKIFATLDIKNQRACIMLTPIDQSVFIVFDKEVVYPVPNKWGKSGATYFELKKVSKSMVNDALKTAYQKKLAGKPSASKTVIKK